MCDVKRCRKKEEINYKGFGMCDKHWREFCEVQDNCQDKIFIFHGKEFTR